MSNGGKLAGSDARVTPSFSLPSDVWDEFEEIADERDSSRSEMIRQFVKDCVREPDEPDTPLFPPADDRLATAYKRLVALSNDDGVARDQHAKSVLGSVLGISKEEVEPVVLLDLQRRGYVRRLSNLYGRTSWKLVGWNSEGSR